MHEALTAIIILAASAIDHFVDLMGAATWLRVLVLVRHEGCVRFDIDIKAGVVRGIIDRAPVCDEVQVGRPYPIYTLVGFCSFVCCALRDPLIL
jgi:hypothetical protein